MNPALSALGVLAYPNIDPVFLSLGPIQLRWYGPCYVAGILCGWLYGRALVGNPKLWANGVSPITKLQIGRLYPLDHRGIILAGASDRSCSTISTATASILGPWCGSGRAACPSMAD